MKNNVIDIFKNKKAEQANKDFKLGLMFDEAIKRNEKNRDKLREERLKDNLNVLKSYRIKQGK